MFIDPDEKQLNFKVAVRGTRAFEWLRSLAKAIGAPVDSESEAGSDQLMLPLALGEVRGWKVEFHFYATNSPSVGARLLTLKSADGVVEIIDADAAAQVAQLTKDLSDFGVNVDAFHRFASSRTAVDGFDTTDPAEGPLALVKKLSKRLIIEAREHLV